MKPFDILGHLDNGQSSFGFVATYEFDPQFFERRVMGTKSFGSADRLLIFMDRGRYQELVNGGLNVAGFNRRYMVVPISRSNYVFHPKLYLVLGDKRSDALIGSCNCTNAGIGYNVEICSAFSMRSDNPAHDDQEARAVLRQVYDALKDFSADAGELKNVIEQEFFAPAESRYPWLHPKVTIPVGSIRLIHSHQRDLWHQVLENLKGKMVRRITVIAPFYDAQLTFIKQLREHWPRVPLTIVAQPQYATLAGSKLEKIFHLKKDQLFAAHPQPGRRLHAKGLAFETDAETYWLSGSPNASHAAFNGGNTEAALWLCTKETAETLLQEGGLGLERIDPIHFVPGADQEPTNAEQVEGGLVLSAAVLAENGVLECTIEERVNTKDLTLRVRNLNESLPVFSLPVQRRGQGKVGVELQETQVLQIRVAAVCEIKALSADGKEIISNPAALVQLYHLLRERPISHGRSDTLRTIEETGESLVSYVDTLPSVGEAVEFFKNCSIRFYDGQSAGGGSKSALWRPRDPFRPDTPPGWFDFAIASSATDLRDAIVDFVERHQTQKLYKHVRRGNLNGLPNFLDIFRTLNGLLLTYSARAIAGGVPVIPFGYVTKFMMTNIELLIGNFEEKEENYDGDGFISSICENLDGEENLIFERIKDERVPQMVIAAIEAMIAVRADARNLAKPDNWAAERLVWVTRWIKTLGLPKPTAAEILAAKEEYLPEKKAA